MHSIVKTSDVECKHDNDENRPKSIEERLINMSAQGEALIKNKQWADAYHAFSHCIDWAPKNTRYLRKRMQCFYNAGHFEKTISDLMSVIKIDPNYHTGMAFIASIYLCINKDIGMAQKMMRRALKIQPLNQLYEARLENLNVILGLSKQDFNRYMRNMQRNRFWGIETHAYRFDNNTGAIIELDPYEDKNDTTSTTGKYLILLQKSKLTEEVCKECKRKTNENYFLKHHQICIFCLDKYDKYTDLKVECSNCKTQVLANTEYSVLLKICSVCADKGSGSKLCTCKECKRQVHDYDYEDKYDLCIICLDQYNICYYCAKLCKCQYIDEEEYLCKSCTNVQFRKRAKPQFLNGTADQDADADDGRITVLKSVQEKNHEYLYAVFAPEAKKHNMDVKTYTTGFFATQFVQVANQLASESKWISAVNSITEAIKLNPNVGNTFKLRGMMYVHLGLGNHAIKDLHEAIRLDPNSPAHVYAKLALLYVHSTNYHMAQMMIKIANEKELADMQYAKLLSHYKERICGMFGVDLKMKLEPGKSYYLALYPDDYTGSILTEEETNDLNLEYASLFKSMLRRGDLGELVFYDNDSSSASDSASFAPELKKKTMAAEGKYTSLLDTPFVRAQATAPSSASEQQTRAQIHSQTHTHSQTQTQTQSKSQGQATLKTKTKTKKPRKERKERKEPVKQERPDDSFDDSHMDTMRLQRMKEDEEKRVKWEEMTGLKSIGKCKRFNCERYSKKIMEDQMFYRVTCSKKCNILYHEKACWRYVTRNFQQRDLEYGANCITPQCEGTIESIHLMSSLDKINRTIVTGVAPRESHPPHSEKVEHKVELRLSSSEKVESVVAPHQPLVPEVEYKVAPHRPLVPEVEPVVEPSQPLVPKVEIEPEMAKKDKSKIDELLQKFQIEHLEQTQVKPLVSEAKLKEIETQREKEREIKRVPVVEIKSNKKKNKSKLSLDEFNASVKPISELKNKWVPPSPSLVHHQPPRPIPQLASKPKTNLSASAIEFVPDAKALYESPSPSFYFSRDAVSTFQYDTTPPPPPPGGPSFETMHGINAYFEIIKGTSPS